MFARLHRTNISRETPTTSRSQISASANSPESAEATTTKTDPENTPYSDESSGYHSLANVAEKHKIIRRTTNGPPKGSPSSSSSQIHKEPETPRETPKKTPNPYMDDDERQWLEREEIGCFW